MSRKKRIAFDLDDTLIPTSLTFPIEQQGWVARLLGHESIREGTIKLMSTLREEGWDIGIYTTSFRRPMYVKWLFLLHGIRINYVINQYDHHNSVSRCGGDYQYCSKYPPKFNIDLLVDESEGVWIESQRYGFRIARVHPTDMCWGDAVLEIARSL